MEHRAFLASDLGTENHHLILSMPEVRGGRLREISLHWPNILIPQLQCSREKYLIQFTKDLYFFFTNIPNKDEKMQDFPRGNNNFRHNRRGQDQYLASTNRSGGVGYMLYQVQIDLESSMKHR